MELPVAGSVETDQWEHYGLALQRYTHFTSPIRRYADVVVHRLLLAAVAAGHTESQLQPQPAQLADSELQQLADHLNERNRVRPLTPKQRTPRICGIASQGDTFSLVTGNFLSQMHLSILKDSMILKSGKQLFQPKTKRLLSGVIRLFSVPTFITSESRGTRASPTVLDKCFHILQRLQLESTPFLATRHLQKTIVTF